MKHNRMLQLLAIFLVLLLTFSFIFSACSSTPAPTTTAAPATSAAPKTSAPPATSAAPTTSAAPATSASAPATSSAAPKPAQESTYEFAAMFPMTGPMAFIGASFTAGIQEAIDHINAEGGVNGMKLKFVVEDHQATPAGGVAAMNKIILNKSIAYSLTSFVDPALTAQPIAAQNHVLLLNCGGIGDDLLNLDYQWNNQVMPSLQCPVMASYMYELGFRKVAVLSEDSAQAVSDRKFFGETFQKLGGKIVASEIFEGQAMDFSTQLAKIKAAQPDLIYLVAFGDQGATGLKQIRALGIKATVCGITLDDPAVLIPAGADAEGLYSVGPYLDLNSKLPYARKFIDEYNSKYAPKGGGAYWPWAGAYENVHILAELIKIVQAKGGNIHDGAQLQQALDANRTFDSVFGDGKLTFTSDHQVLKAIGVMNIKNGVGVLAKLATRDEVQKAAQK